MSNWITIRTFDNYIEANIVENVLNEEGIETRMQDENTVTANWLWSNAIGGIKLQIKVEDETVAEDILNRLAEQNAKEQETIGFYESTEGLDAQNRICIHCGSKNTKQVLLDKKWSLGSILAFGFPIFFQSKKWHCFHCGKKF